jgi:type I restriction enzyme S subunit
MGLKPGYNLTEVGIVPSEWEVLPITEVTTAIFLGLTSKVDYVSGGGIPLVRASDIADGRLSFASARTISLRQHRELTKYRRPKRGDVLVSKSGSLGVCAIVDVDTEFSIYESIIVLQPNNLIDSSFLLSLLRYEATQSRMIGDRVGSSVGHLNLEMFRKLVVPVPRITEQSAIGRALSDVDALLSGLENLMAKKRDLKQAAMQQLLTGQKRLPGFSGEWEVKKIGELLKYERPEKYLVKSAEYEYTAKTPVLTANKSFVLGYTNEDFGIYGELPAIIFDDFTTDCKYVDFPFKVKSSAIKILKTRSAETNLKFVYERMRLVRFAPGDHKRYYISEYQHVVVGTPKSDEQTAIAQVLADMDAEIVALEQRLAKTRAIKQGMMQELLTGRIRLVGN